jgi:hypothetical protein
MKRTELEHIIRASADIAQDDEIVVIGSQSILGQFPNAPDELRVSNEADVYPLNKPERWELIDGSIGELSPFHETYGYYAQGVEEGTALLPRDWQTRLVRISNANTRGASGLCLEVHDLLISKYLAGREKDRRFVRAALAHGLADRDTLLERLLGVELDDETRLRITRLIEHDAAQPKKMPE